MISTSAECYEQNKVGPLFVGGITEVSQGNNIWAERWMVELNQLHEGLRGWMVASSRNSKFQAPGGTARPEWWAGVGMEQKVRAERWTGIWPSEPWWGVWPSVTKSHWSVLVSHRLYLCFERLFSLSGGESIVWVCVCVCVCVFCFAFSLWFIAGYWIQFPVLFSRTLVFIHSLYNSLHRLIPNSQSIPP